MTLIAINKHDRFSDYSQSVNSSLFLFMVLKSVMYLYLYIHQTVLRQTTTQQYYYSSSLPQSYTGPVSKFLDIITIIVMAHDDIHS